MMKQCIVMIFSFLCLINIKHVHGDNNAIIINVYPHSERIKEKGSIAGSIHIPVNKLNYPQEELITMIKHRSKKNISFSTSIQIYCSSHSENSIKKAIHLLETKGFTNVSALS